MLVSIHAKWIQLQPCNIYYITSAGSTCKYVHDDVYSYSLDNTVTARRTFEPKGIIVITEGKRRWDVKTKKNECGYTTLGKELERTPL